MAKPFFTSQPERSCSRQLYTVKDVQDEIRQFKVLHEVDDKLGSAQYCDDPNRAARWRKYVRNEVINCAGAPVELDFFEKLAGGKTEKIPAKEMYFMQHCDYDRNIVAKESKTGAGPGAPVTFTLARSHHSVNGSESYTAEGWELFIYEDMQFVRITKKHDSVPFAHAVTVIPKNGRYTVKIRAGKKILVAPATQVGGYTCNTDHTGTHITPGYIYKMNMMRLRVQWKQAVDLMKGYKDVLQFGIMFDNEGNEINCWEYYKKIKAREELKYAFNLHFFTGQKVTNPDVEALMSDNSYPGFDGYIPSVQSAGGIIYPFDPVFGIDPYADFASLLLRQDSLKRNTEWTILRALPFQIAFDRNWSKVAKSENGACTYETFKRTGKKGEDIVRMGVKSLALWNMTLHFKDFDALSDTRSIGNGDFPFMAFMMPSANLKDSNGRDVPPIEFFVNEGCALDGGYEEHDYDARKEKSGCEEVGGWMAKTVGMVTHCLQDHIILKPRRRC